MRKKYGFTLQVEDEWPFWSGKPERYAALGKRYRDAVPGRPLLEIDWNVVEDCHEEGNGGLPAAKPTGEEVRQVVYNIDLYQVRPVFYAEDTLYEHDFRNITTVLARQAAVTPLGKGQWAVDTPYMVSVHSGLQADSVRLNGKRWLGGKDGDIIVPPGKHTLSFYPTDNIDKRVPRLLDISAELKEAAFSGNRIEFRYEAPCSRCYAVLDRTPAAVFIDGSRRECVVYPSAGGCAVQLPPGRHRVRILASK